MTARTTLKFGDNLLQAPKKIYKANNASGREVTVGSMSFKLQTNVTSLISHLAPGEKTATGTLKIMNSSKDKFL